MYDIYIKNYEMNGALQTTETPFFSIPMEPDEPNAVLEPKVVAEMGKSGSFDFGMELGHPYYESLLPMKTIFRIEYDGDTIFRGRVLTVDVGHFTGSKKVHCESDFSFFLDSQAEGIEDGKRQKTSVLVYLQKLIADHNTQVSEGFRDKEFVLGEVPGQYSLGITDEQKVTTDATSKYGSTSWKDTQSALVELSNNYGGYFRTRYQNGTIYLDWLDAYYNQSVNLQTIELGENLIDITSGSTVNNIFTALIPLGSSSGSALTIKGYETEVHGDNNRILVPQICDVFTDEELNKGYHRKEDYLNAISDYGIICKTQSFQNADTQEKLWEYATDWIKNNYIGGVHEFNVSALDMHVIGESSGKFLVGDRVRVIYPDVDARDTNPTATINRVLTFMKIEYDLYNPEKDSYQIGVPNLILKKEYGEKKASGGGGGGARQQENDENDFFGFKTEQQQLNWQSVISATYNSDVYQDYLASLPEEVRDEFDATGQKTAFAYLWAYDHLSDLDKIVESHYLTIDGTSRKMDIMHSPFVAQYGPDAGQAVIDLIAASVQAKNGNITIDIKEGIDPLHHRIPRPGSGEAMKTAYKIQSTSSGGSATISKFTGKSTTNVGTEVHTVIQDGISGIVAAAKEKLGSFSLDGSVDDLITNVKGAINLDGVDFKAFTSNGAVDTAELDGLTALFKVGRDDPSGQTPEAQNGWKVKANDTVTYQDAQGQTQMSDGFVTAKDFDIDNVIPSFKTKMAVVDTLIAEKATITQLEAVNARIDNLTAGTIIAGTSIASDYVSFNNASGIDLNIRNITFTTGHSTAKDAFWDADIDFDNGDFTLTLTRMNGQTQVLNFDVASSTWYTTTAHLNAQSNSVSNLQSVAGGQSTTMYSYVDGRLVSQGTGVWYVRAAGYMQPQTMWT